MSQTTAAEASPTERAAAQAVFGHHAQLAADLRRHTEELLTAADDPGTAGEAERARHRLLDYLRTELVPHAAAEEKALYPAAAALPQARLLIDGMLDEHRVLVALSEEIESAPSSVRAAAAARALAALFATHVAKENELVVPLILAAPTVSLADLLAGMHEALDADDQREPQADACGCGGCGCGAGTPGDGGQPTGTLAVDQRLDVRELRPAQRHAIVLSALEGLTPQAGLVLVAPHAPRPLLAQIEQRFPGRFEVEWLRSGPDVWQLRLSRTIDNRPRSTGDKVDSGLS